MRNTDGKREGWMVLGRAEDIIRQTHRDNFGRFLFCVDRIVVIPAIVEAGDIGLDSKDSYYSLLFFVGPSGRTQAARNLRVNSDCFGRSSRGHSIHS